MHRAVKWGPGDIPGFNKGKVTDPSVKHGRETGIELGEKAISDGFGTDEPMPPFKNAD